MKKWLLIGGAMVAAVFLLTARAGPGNIGTKALFYSGAVGVVFLKVFGLVAGTVAWPLTILFALAGTVADAKPTSSTDEIPT